MDSCSDLCQLITTAPSLSFISLAENLFSLRSVGYFMTAVMERQNTKKLGRIVVLKEQPQNAAMRNASCITGRQVYLKTNPHAHGYSSFSNRFPIICPSFAHHLPIIFPPNIAINCKHRQVEDVCSHQKPHVCETKSSPAPHIIWLVVWNIFYFSIYWE